MWGAKEGLDEMRVEKQVIMDQKRGKRRQESMKDKWMEGREKTERDGGTWRSEVKGKVVCWE